MTAPDRIAVYWTAVDDEVMPSWLMAQTPKSTAFDDDIPKSTRIEYIRADLSDLAAIREAALKEAAYVAINACLVPPDGGNPTEAESLVCEEAYRRILALIGEKK